jgi:hypothetical protein
MSQSTIKISDVTGRPLSDFASELRGRICMLYDAQRPENTILAPGILISLQILFAVVGVKRLLVSDQEYYSSVHFPAQEVKRAALDDLLDCERVFMPDAVVISIVSWRGEPLDAEMLFRALRRRRSAKRPLLILDYSHGGAIGFPPISHTAADVVCGDLNKWVTPPRRRFGLSFLWFEDPCLFRQAALGFAPFFLATETTDCTMSARWINPRELKWTVCWLRLQRLSRKSLVLQDLANQCLTKCTAERLELETAPKCNIVWLTNPQRTSVLNIERLSDLGLAWVLPNSCTRILCRADICKGYMFSDSLENTAPLGAPSSYSGDDAK